MCSHLCSSLCQDILADIIPDSSSDAVYGSTYTRYDEEVKQSILPFVPSIRMSKSCCNAKLCAFITFFIHKMLFVAKSGDCTAMLRKKNKETIELQVIKVSADYSCDNSHKTKLVIERSHDRNAKRYH